MSCPIHFEFANYSFFLFNLELKQQVSTVIHSHCSLESQIQFQTKMGKVYSVQLFSDQNSIKTIPIGTVHTYTVYELYKGVPTPSYPHPGQIIYLLQYVYTYIFCKQTSQLKLFFPSLSRDP